MMKTVPRASVGVFVFKDGKFAMGQRKSKHGTNTWALPGGYLEFGESFQQAARREVREETGLDINNIRFGAVTNAVFEEEGKHSVVIWMLSNWAGGKQTLKEPDKFVKQGWYNFDSLPEPLFLPWNQLLESQFIEDIKQELRS